jgi:hypothetical protein
LRFTSNRSLRSALTENAFMIDVLNDSQRDLTNDNSIETCAFLIENLQMLLNKVSVFVSLIFGLCDIMPTRLSDVCFCVGDLLPRE